MRYIKNLFIPFFLLLFITAAFSQTQQKKRYPRPDKSYRHALKLLWTKVYPKGGKTLYCGQSFANKNRKQRQKHINAEHVFPMAWASKDLGCGTRKQCQRNSSEFRTIEADLHNIYPAKININKARSHYRFAEITGEKRRFGTCDFEVDKKRRIAEPAPSVRGDIARAMLYMAYQYDLTLFAKNRKLLQQWDKIDPPSNEEKRRAAIIERLQGKENPYINRYPFTP